MVLSPWLQIDSGSLGGSSPEERSPSTGVDPPVSAPGRFRFQRTLLAAVFLFAAMTVGGTPTAATDSATHFVVSHDGSSYRAESLTTTYTGALKAVVESAVADLNSGTGGTVTFTSGVFDLGAEWFRFNQELIDITFEGQGIDVTVIRNSTTIDADTEPFNFRGTNRVVIRDLTVSAGGTPRTTSDAIDFDRGNNSVVERVKITASRGKGIIFDGKDIDGDGTPWTSEGNLVRDCIIEGTNNDGIQFLASSNNRVEGCTIRNVVGDGIEIRKSQSTAPQPNKKSNGNVLTGNVIDRAGENGIRVTSSDNNRVTGNNVTNSSIVQANMDGIRLAQENGITCDDNVVDANTATDTQPVKTQAYGLHIATSSCNRTVVGSNNFAGNKTGAIRDLGTDTRYQATDTTPPTNPANLVATAVTATRVDLSWTASTDNIGVTGYDVFRNGVLLTAVGATTSYQDASVLPATAYSYEVRAFDAAANRSGFSNAASVTTPTATSLSFTPVDDAHVRADLPTANFGATGDLTVDNSPVKHILLKFTVAGVGGGTVSSAKLRIYCIDPASEGGQLRRVPSNSWSESTVTWNTAPANDSALLATVGAVTANTWYEIDVTTLITGDGTYSVKITSTSSNGADYVSSEGSAALRPALVVTTGGGGPPPDTQAPSTPTGLIASAANPNLVNLAWTASTDNVGVTGYEILRNGAVLATVGAVTSHQDNTVGPDTTYAYQVRAVDAAGNRSGLSNTASVTTPGSPTNTCQDSSPGAYTVTVCITAPAPGASLVGDASVTASVAVSGASPGVQKVIFWLGSEYVLTDYQAPFAFTLETTRWADGARTLQAEAYMRDGFVAQPATIASTFANGISEPTPNTRQFTATQGTAPPPGQPLVLAAVGDGADGAINAGRVTDLIASWNPNLFTYLGDVYERGTPTEFTNWYGRGTLYGRFRPLTNPVIGNHENLTPNSAGYFDYWDNAPNYYSVQTAGWHLLYIDSTGAFGQTSPSSAQYQWIASQLATSQAPCTMALFHHPAWTIGPSDTSSDPGRMRNIWALLANNGVDLVLAGHDHNYQRWRPLDASGNFSSSGTTGFVVGTGGHGIQEFIRTDSRVAAGFDTSPAAFGALRLELNPTGAAYQFVDVDGRTLDSGAVQCTGTAADITPPTTPTNLTASATNSSPVELSWTASTDNVGVVGYDIYRDGVLLTQAGAGTTYVDNSTSGGTTYTYEVSARDAAGNTSPRSAPASVATPTLLVNDDFETGDLSQWTTVAGLIVQSQQVFSGGYAARSTSTGAAAWAWRQLASGQTELFYRMRFKLISQPGGTSYLGKFRTATGSSLLGFYVTSTNRLGIRNDFAGLSTTSTTSVTLATWHELQVRIKINGATGQSEVWYDGAPVAALARTFDLGTAPVGRIQLGDNAGGTYDIALDNVELDTRFIGGSNPPDTTPPSAPTNLGASATSPNRVDLSWTAATDAVGVVGYDIYRNTGLLTTIGAQTTYTDLAVSAGSSYTYQVRARDAAGNVSPSSNAAQVTLPASGTLLFGDDFETGDLSKWTSVSGLIVQTQEVFAGGYAARGTSSGAATWAWRQLASGQTELYYRLRFKLISGGPKTIYLLKFRTATGGSLLGVYVSNKNRLSIRNDVAKTSTTSTTTVGLGSWHELQVRIRINGATGQSEVWYDGAPVATLARTFDLGTAPVGRIQLGDNAGAPSDVAFDNVEVNTQFIE